MKRRFSILATALLTIGIALPAKARADSIVITGGTAVVGDDYIGVVDIHGTQGFRAQLQLGLLQTGGPWQWNHAPTGTPIRHDAIFASWDGFGTVTLNGVTYHIPGEHEVIAVWTDGDAIPMPPPGPEPIRLIAPFTLHPSTPSTFQVMLPWQQLRRLSPVRSRDGHAGPHTRCGGLRLAHQPDAVRVRSCP